MFLKLFNSFTVLPQTVVILGFAYVISSPWFPDKEDVKISLGYYQDSLLNFTELTGKYGYISEEHKVITDDGYILTIFRIVKAKNCGGKTRSPPVLLMHGLFQSSNAWIDSGPNSGLAYLIADACYDLWVGNVRGNFYGRQHVQLNPNKENGFWDFDIDKIGTYDIPAMIDYLLNNTKSKKLNYIGFSQGAGIFFVMCSERPEYCNKVQVMIALGPATRTKHSKSFLFRSLLQMAVKWESVLSSYGFQELMTKSSLLQQFLAYFCQLSDRCSSLCEYLIKLLDHVDLMELGSISKTTIKTLFGHLPAGTSLRNMARYGQSLQSSRYQKYDYGKKSNLVIYGSEYPPIYNLSSVTVPVVCFYGNNDGLTDIKDLKWLVSKLPNVVDTIEVEDKLWTHLDFTFSHNTKEMVFYKLNEYLLRHSNK